MKKLISIMTVFAMALSVLAGCGSGTASNASNASTAPGSSAASGEKITLRFSWWGSDARHEATLAAIKKYQELNPNITIEGEYQGYDGYRQKLMTQIAGKTEPDLMQLDYYWNPEFAKQDNVFVDLSKDPNIDLTPYEASTLASYNTVNGKIISLPMNSSGFGIMINKKFFEKFNLDPNTEWTWEKMIDEGAKIHQKDPNAYLFAIESGTATGGVGPFVMSSYIYSKTGKYWANNDTYKIQVEKADLENAFTIIQKLFSSGAAQPLGDASLFTGQMEQNPKWLNAEMGFTVDWTATVGKYKSSIGAENFTVGKPPFAENGNNKKIAYTASMGLGVSSRSAHVEEATRFANWLMNDSEAAVLLGTQRSVPNNKNAYKALESANAIDKDIATMIEFTTKAPADPVPLVQSNTEVADVVKNICEKVAFGELTPKDAAAQFMTDVQAKLDSLKTA